MPRAEGERCLDLDADPVRCNCRAVVRAVHREAPALTGLSSPRLAATQSRAAIGREA
jgi:hypothetical protein